ncbi:MAG: polymer-forming cytoskeletal protein [Gammaproteobacteria bacterium]|nr:polymer-forming cytoskeletal protein [Gammaproteobacteria bacterium]
MSDPPRRRLLDQLGTAPTFIAEGSSVLGDLRTSGPLVVCGSVRGDGHIAGDLRLTRSATWTGDIRARQAVIAGQVNGRVAVEERLEIGASARIKGEVSARCIAIARGAVIDGQVSVAGDQDIVRFEEKRQED